MCVHWRKILYLLYIVYYAQNGAQALDDMIYITGYFCNFEVVFTSCNSNILYCKSAA
jgi:hypothetical protein